MAKPASGIDTPEADFIVVGGGSAGAVVASRLAADPANNVLLVEAGGDGRDWLIDMPAGFSRIVADPRFDWRYDSMPDDSQPGRNWLWSAGRMLGGTSALNGQVFIRGTPADFDGWAEQGATGWAYGDVLPFFRKLEGWRGDPGPARGRDGPLPVSPMRDPHPLCRYFMEGCNQAGIPTLTDYNDGSNFGAFLAQTNQQGGLRYSTEKAYLRPAARWPNLQIINHAEVDRVTIEDGAATGVQFTKDGTAHHARARREIVICAGAHGSPALLMRSGIGPAAYLRENGIKPLCDLPGVGRNLQEHSTVAIAKNVTVPTLNMQLGRAALIRHTLNFMLRRKGPLSAPAVQAMALARTRDGLTEPDVQLHFSPLSYAIPPDARSPIGSQMAKRPALAISASVCKPKGRGHVELGPDGRPKISFAVLGNEDDVDTLIASIGLIERIFQTPAFRAIVESARAPSPVPTSRDGWRDHLERNLFPIWHSSGTCRMGVDDQAVVDPQLRLRGVDRLRVADASVMPSITSANTNAATIMIGERAAAMMAAK